MKNLLSVLILFLAFSIAKVAGQSLSAITKAIGEGNAETLGQNFDNTVELSILDTEEAYSRADAVKIVRDFFTKNKVASFSQMHQGASKGQDSQFIIGILNTSVGTYRVYIYMKVTGGKYLVQELRFDK